MISATPVMPAPDARARDGRAPGLFGRLGDAIEDARIAILSRPGFQRWAQRFPLTRGIARRRAKALFDLCAGFVLAQVLSACVKLDLFTVLSQGPARGEDLARRFDLDPAALERLLAAATALGLIRRRHDGRYALGDHGAAMVAQAGLSAMVAHHDQLYADLADPLALMRAAPGAAALAAYWPYATATAPAQLDRDAVGPYTGLMAATQPWVAAAILDAVALGGHRRLMDVAGGSGGFLLAAAARAPGLDLSLVDLPAVVEIARERLDAAGLGSRVACHGLDIFTDPLPVGADLISLVRVIHDHDDARVLTLLKAAHAALPPGGTLLIGEPLADAEGGGSVAAYFQFYLLAMGSGRPRAFPALSALLRAAGFADIRRIGTHVPILVEVVTARRP